MRIQRPVLLIALILLTIWGPIHAQGQNLLTNPGFEDPYITIGGDQTVQVAQGWTPWHVPRGANDPTFANSAPEYYPTAPDSTRIHSGSNAQLISSFFATHTGGVYQRVTNVTAGAQLQLHVFAYIWSSTLDDVGKSEQNGGVNFQVGIDPTGGTDGTSPNVIWSQPVSEYDTYSDYSVSATASGSAVTVFTRSTISFPVKNNNIYLDDASLTGGGGSVTSVPATTAAPTTAATIAVPTKTPTSVPATTAAPTTAVPPTAIPPTAIPPTAVPPTSVPPTAVPPTQPPATLPPVSTVASTDIGIINTTVPTSAATVTQPGPIIIIVTATPVPTEVPTLPPPTPVPSSTPIIIIVTATPLPATTGPNTPTPASGTALPDGFRGTVLYTVQPGDTVGKLATLYGSTIEAIISANGLNNNALIFVGQGIVIPVRLAAPATSTPTPSPVVTTAPGGSGTPATNPGVYTVQPGDTLGRIAQRYNTTVTTLAQINGIVNPDRIFVGQQLTIPGAGTVQPTPPPLPTSTPGSSAATSVPVPTHPATYVVQPGDTLFRISLRFGVPVGRIVQENGILDPNFLFVGQLLYIP
jgi:LysM repeat protein